MLKSVCSVPFRFLPRLFGSLTLAVHFQSLRFVLLGRRYPALPALARENLAFSLAIAHGQLPQHFNPREQTPASDDRSHRRNALKRRRYEVDERARPGLGASAWVRPACDDRNLGKGNAFIDRTRSSRQRPDHTRDSICYPVDWRMARMGSSIRFDRNRNGEESYVDRDFDFDDSMDKARQSRRRTVKSVSLPHPP